MSRLLFTLLAAFAVMLTLVTAARADSAKLLLQDPTPTMYPFMDLEQAAPPIINSQHDPDDTGYAEINAWQGDLSRQVFLFLNAPERDRLTAARIVESNGLAPIFVKYENNLRAVLRPEQVLIFENIVAHQDMAQLAVMTENEWTAYNVGLAQQLHLTAGQQAKLGMVTDELKVAVKPVTEQFAMAFDQVMADASTRVIAEREIRTRMIGVPSVP
jgi:hypothetical protein